MGEVQGSQGWCASKELCRYCCLAGGLAGLLLFRALLHWAVCMLTSVATTRPLSNIFLSCAMGPMRKAVLQAGGTPVSMQTSFQAGFSCACCRIWLPVHVLPVPCMQAMHATLGPACACAVCTWRFARQADSMCFTEAVAASAAAQRFVLHVVLVDGLPMGESACDAQV